MHCSRLDKAINAVFEVVRDTMYERMIQLAKRKLTNKNLLIRKSHSLNEEWKEENIIQKNEDESNVWFVTSQTNSELKYKVKRFQEKYDEELCILQCEECDVCVHTFRCSCPDNVIYLNICKYIHKVGALEKSIKDSYDENNRDVIDINHERIPCKKLLILLKILRKKVLITLSTDVQTY